MREPIRCGREALWAGALLVVVLSVAACFSANSAAEESESITALTEMSLEDLMDIEVISVSKRKESRQQAAAAIHVITQEDIRRSGATSVPELLRMVPGVHVARINANRWRSSNCAGRVLPFITDIGQSKCTAVIW